MKNKILLVLGLLGFLGDCVADPARVTPAGFEGSKQPRIAVGEAGKLFVAFGKGNGVYMASSEDAGQTFAPPQKIGELPKLALGMRRGPRIAASRNTVTVTAISHQDGNLYSWTSDSAARTWGKPQAINSVANSAREGMQGLAGNGKSDLFAVWLDLRNKKTELWGARSSDGGRSWGPNIRVYKSPDETICECCHPSVTFSPNGEIIVMWRNWLNGNRDLYRSISADGGASFSEAAKLGTGSWPLKGCPMDGGGLASAPSGAAFVWRREQQLFCTEDPSAETLLSQKGTQPVVVATAHGFEYGWQDGGKVYWKSAPEKEPGVLAETGGYLDAVWSASQGSDFWIELPTA